MIEKFHSLVKGKPISSFTIIRSDTSFYVETYNIKIGSITEYSLSEDNLSTSPVTLLSPYHFVFKNNQLRWWGNSDKMRIDSDRIIASIADTLFLLTKEKLEQPGSLSR